MSDDDAYLVAVSPDRPWWPMRVPEDTSDLALGMLDSVTIIACFEDTLMAMQRAMTVDADAYDEQQLDAVSVARSNLARELHRRLVEVDYQAEHRRRIEEVVRSARPRLAS